MSIGRTRAAASMTAATLLLFSGGCQQSPEVTGRVSYQGEEVEEGAIQFCPASGNTVSAMITNGEYGFDAKDELQVGAYKVRIFADKATGRMLKSPDGWNENAPAATPEYAPWIPPQYNASTTLTAEVAPGKNSIDFLLP